MNSDIPQETELCSNCKREVPSCNYVMHTIHCQRNLTLCPKCDEPIRREEFAQHNEEQHVVIFCKSCNKQMEKYELEVHLTEHCPNRILKCQICDIEVGASELGEHENYCGARTEKCSECGDFVMLKYKQLHLDSNHTFVKLSDEPGPSPAWQNGRRTLGNFLSSVQTASTTPPQGTSHKKKTSQTSHRARHTELTGDGSREDTGRLPGRHTGIPTAVRCANGMDASNVNLNDPSTATQNKTKKAVLKTTAESTEDFDRDRSLALQLTEYEEMANYQRTTDRLMAMRLSEELNTGDTATALDTALALDVSSMLHNSQPPAAAAHSPTASDSLLSFHLSEELNSEPPPMNVLDFDSLLNDDTLSLSNLAERQLVNVDTGDQEEPDLLCYNQIRRPRALALPCEFCGSMIPAEELIVHQTGCAASPQEGEKVQQPPRRRNPPWMSEIVEIPCEFCEEMFPTFRLNSHQLLCDKNWSRARQLRNNIEPVTSERMRKKENVKRSVRGLKDMNTRHQTGLQNGLEPSSPRLNGLGTRTELLRGQAGSRPKTKSTKSQRAPSPPSPDM